FTVAEHRERFNLSGERGQENRWGPFLRVGRQKWWDPFYGKRACDRYYRKSRSDTQPTQQIWTVPSRPKKAGNRLAAAVRTCCARGVCVCSLWAASLPAQAETGPWPAAGPETIQPANFLQPPLSSGPLDAPLPGDFSLEAPRPPVLREPRDDLPSIDEVFAEPAEPWVVWPRNIPPGHAGPSGVLPTEVQTDPHFQPLE